MDQPAVDELHALRRRDDELAGTQRDLQAAGERAASVRARAEAIEAFLSAYRAEEARLREAIAEAERARERRIRELADAQEELGRAQGEEHEHAEKAVARARDRVADADSRLARARAAHERLEGDAAELPGDLGRLEDEARALAEATPYLPAPDAGARGLVEWAAQARAELFVALGQIDRQREQVIREAVELGTMLLGEPTFGATPAQVLARVERAP